MATLASSPVRAAARSPRATRRSRLRQLWRQAGPLQLAAAAALLVCALLFARFTWELPGVRAIEQRLYDIRAVITMPKAAQDPRITLAVYDDATRIQTGRISPLDRSILAATLRRLDRLHPRAIGIDMLFDQPTPEDSALLAAFRAMRTPTFLALATNATNAEAMSYERETWLRGFLAGLRGTLVRPTSIRFEPDSDGVMRVWPARPPGLPPLMANALVPERSAFADYRGPVRYRLPARVDEPVFNELTMQFLANPAIPDEVLRPLVQGRTILIGGDLPDTDQFDTPMSLATGASTAGLLVHAHMLAQVLDDAPFALVPDWPLWTVALICVAVGALASASDAAWWKVALLGLAMLAAFALVPLWLQGRGVDTSRLPVFGWFGGAWLAFASVAGVKRTIGAQQRRIAHAALGKYLPRDIANEIIAEPERLSLHGEKCSIFAMFTDLEGFTKLSHAIPPETVATLLNRYLDTLSEVVLAHGGTIDKFVGDAVVAFWGAPIARPDDADRAVQAAVAMYRAGEAFRASAPAGVPPLGVTRVGLHQGEAIVGNFGGEGRIQYTALGDAMNCAARLESANKQLRSTVLVSRSARERSSLPFFRPLGRIAVSGRSTPLELFEPVPDLSAEDVTLLTAAYERFDRGDVTALDEIERYAADHPDDEAAANLVYRLRSAGPGGTFVLESK